MKKSKKMILKNENGSITLLVIIMLLFFLVMTIGMYTSNNNKKLAQLKEIEKIQENYNKELSEIDEIYEQQQEANLGYNIVYIKQSNPTEIYNPNDWTNDNIIVKIEFEDTTSQDQTVKVKNELGQVTATYTYDQIINEEIIITENSTIIVTKQGEEKEYIIDKIDKQNS